MRTAVTILVAAAVLFPLTGGATDVSRATDGVLTTPDVHYVWGDVWGDDRTSIIDRGKICRIESQASY